MKKSQCPKARAAAAAAGGETKLLESPSPGRQTVQGGGRRGRPIKACNGVKWACSRPGQVERLRERRQLEAIW